MSLLLAPAGSPEGLDAAIAGGADEVYLGGGDFNARIRAKNFSLQDLVTASKKCEKHNVNLFITLNTLVFDKEFKSLIDYVCFLEKEVRPSAYIVQDLGVALFLKENFPDTVLHASTQMQQHSSSGVKLLSELGFGRVVLAREMSREDILAFPRSLIETEVFVHGALCVSASGGCLMSSFIGKRSGNRGQCAQPCRLDYKGDNPKPLSLKDLSLASHIPSLLDMNITSLKIEGRMKSPDYIYTVTRIYRELIDEKRAATKQEIDLLERVFSRSGFTDGYYTDNLGPDMFGFRSAMDKKKTKSLELPALPKTQIKAREKRRFSPALPLVMPVKKEENVLSPKEQRGFVFRFEGDTPSPRLLNRYYDLCARIDLPLEKVSVLKDPEYTKVLDKVSLILPRSVFDSETQGVQALLTNAKELGIRQVTLSNVAHLPLCEGFFLHGDYSLNVTNSHTLSLLDKLSFSSVMISPEVSPNFFVKKDIPLALEYITYGKIPLMYTQNSIIQNIKGTSDTKDLPNTDTLVDRTNSAFEIIAQSATRNTIYNSVPLYLADKTRALRRSGVGLYTLLFVNEHKDENAVDSLVGKIKAGENPDFLTKGFTRGYFVSNV